MTIQTLIPATRAEWLALRRETIGGSESACLLGEHPWTSLSALWAEKSGMVDGLNEETPAIRRGRFLESVAIEFLREDKPEWKITPNSIGMGGRFYRDIDAGLSCTPDAFVIDPARPGFGIVQIKSVAQMIFKKKWLVEGEIEFPIYAAIQAIQEASLTGASWACVAALVVDFGIDLHVVDIPLDTGIWERLKEESSGFWQSVRDGKPPPYNFERDGKLIGKIYRYDDGSTVDLSGINDLPELAEADARLAATMKAADIKRKAIRARFLSEMKDARVAIFNGDVIATAKTVSKDGYAVKPSTFRQLRIKSQELSA